MHLIALLAAGVRGAEMGTAEIYERGTATFAELFTTATGDGGFTPTVGRPLDQYGGAEWYVNESVDLIIKDSDGAIVRTATEMVSAANVEVRSQSFTGTGYNGEGSAVSYPIPLSSVLDRWNDNAGAPDWKVRIGSTATTLQTAFASVSGLFFNVRATAYGAKGDGVADDTSAIQAALTAANAFPGGVVFFPGGTYRITSALTVPGLVSIMGAGASASKIQIDHASASALSFSAGSVETPRFVAGITIAPLQSNSGKMIAIESAGYVCIENCSIGGPLLTGKCLSLASVSTNVTLNGCALYVAHAATGYFVYAPVSGFVSMVNCRMVFGATNLTNTSGLVHLRAGGFISNCTVDLSAISNGAANGYVFGFADSPNVTLAGSRIVAPAVSTSITTLEQSVARFFELGLGVPANVITAAPYCFSGVRTNHEGSFHLSREVRQAFAQNDTGDVAIPAATVGMFENRRTTNGAQNANFDPPNAGGQRFALLWNNDHAAGGGTITIVGNVKGLVSFTVNANRASLYQFRSIEVGQAGGASTVYYWVLEGAGTTNFTL